MYSSKTNGIIIETKIPLPHKYIGWLVWFVVLSVTFNNISDRKKLECPASITRVFENMKFSDIPLQGFEITITRNVSSRPMPFEIALNVLRIYYYLDGNFKFQSMRHYGGIWF